MEKRSIESSYDILTNTEPIANQFFILQEDGTILATDKDIQYITQAPDINEDEQNDDEAGECVDFDATEQQYYVDVNSAHELISINDQYVIPSVDGSVYTHSYLPQSEAAVASHQNEANEMDEAQLRSQLQLTSVQLLDESQQENNFTEITLSDEQYQLLQQKGWILLDCHNKVFVLNSLGLHDITDNDKLIQKLKSEMQEPYVQIESKPSLESTDSDPTEPESLLKQESDSELVIASDDLNTDCTNEYVDVEMDNHSSNSNEADIDTKLTNVLHNQSVIKPLRVKAGRRVQTLNCDSIKIKTKYIFKDIPNKILLGRTVNGKNLYAKVTKVIKDKVSVQKSIIKSSTTNRKTPASLQIEMESQEDCGFDSGKFVSLVRESYRMNSVPSDAAVAEAASYVAQLGAAGVSGIMAAPHVVVTKLVIRSSSEGQVLGQPVLVTGTVKTISDVHSFQHEPQMLRTLLHDRDSGSTDGSVSNEPVPLFHIHVTEHEPTQRTHIQYTTRKFPLEVLRDGRKRHGAPRCACAACGRVFPDTAHYDRHQEHCCVSEPAPRSTADGAAYCSTTRADGTRVYTCLTCQATFSRQFNCIKHGAVHAGRARPLRCALCAGVYTHAATLHKHILKHHVHIDK